MNRLLVAVLVLPVEVPVVDSQQRLLATVRQRGPRLHPLSQVVHVRCDAQHVDRNRQPIAVLDDVGRSAGRDADGLRREQHRDRRQRCRPVREVDPDGRLHVDRFGTGQQVELQDEIGPRIQRPGDCVRERRRGLSGRPAQEVAGGEPGVVEHQAVVAGRGLRGVERARRAGPVEQDAGVVDDASAAGAGSQLDGAHPAPGVQLHGEHEVAVDVGAAGGQKKGIRQRHDEVRCSELPAARGARRRREVGRVAFRRAGRRPPGQQGDLRVGEAPLVPEAAVAGNRLPGRHPPLGGDRRDPRRLRARVGVGRQAERADAVLPVAADAVGMKDRGDVPVERHGAGLSSCSEAPVRGAGRARGADRVRRPEADGDERRRGHAGDETFVSRHGARSCEDRRSISGPADPHRRDVRAGLASGPPDGEDRDQLAGGRPHHGQSCCTSHATSIRPYRAGRSGCRCR